MKYLRLQKEGKESYRSAKTRSWEKAELEARTVRDEWDPEKQKLKALIAQHEEKQAAQITIADTLERWVASATKGIEDENSRRKYQTAARKIGAWARYADPESKRTNRKDPLVYVSEVTRDALDRWVVGWGRDASRPQDRFKGATGGALLEKVKKWLEYCVDIGWITTNPATKIKAISRDSAQTLPLLDGRYESVIAATYAYDECARPDDRFGPELRAIIELQRWAGLRISDALLAARSRLDGNRFTLIPYKTRRVEKSKLVVILPDHVVAALDSLPSRPGVDPRYFFWSGTSKVKSLTGLWQKKFARLNDYLTLVDYEDDPQPLKFHSHQLRDTFAVEQLLSGTPMEDVSKMLGHKSIKITEKYYAAWVPARQIQLEEKMIAALRRQGAKVSLRAKVVSIIA
jgi:integrase